MLVILWTDALLFLLGVLGVAFILFAHRHEHLLAPWRRVVRNPLAMGALVVLLAFAIPGLLDSIHYRPRLHTQEGTSEVRYGAEILSGLDLLLSSLRERQEKTYSAPLATHLQAMETVETSDGRRLREYPRLSHAGRHLVDPVRDWWPDIRATLIKSGLVALGLWGLMTGLVVWRLARRAALPVAVALGKFWRGDTRLPWRTLLGMVGLLLLVGLPAGALALDYHLLGTDKVGEDVLYQSLKGIRTGLLIGTLTTLVMLPAALLLGILAGYFRGWVDDLIQYLYTTLSSVPGVLLIAAAILMLDVFMENHPDAFASVTERADIRLLFLCLILGVTSWTSLCRLLRGETFKLRELEFVQSSLALGGSHAWILWRHVLPNVFHLVLITAVLDFSGLVLAEAVLSYVNIGVDPAMNSWGNMINSARLEMAREPMVWWSLSAAFCFMFVLVLAANLFADAVREAFDPRLRDAL